MASVGMVNGSSSISSIYGNRNVLSGLASGMDTESMIENAVAGIKLKIQNLQKRRTKVEWQQEAYRSIIDKAVGFGQKYTSYTSKTNLLSGSFFNSAVLTKTQGKYADKVSATGKTSSDIKLRSVQQMAKAATYTVSGLSGLSKGEIQSVTSEKPFDISGTIPVNAVSGTLSFQYGGVNGTTFDVSFDELEDLSKMSGRTSAEKLANAINKKLSEVAYTYTKNGASETTTADKAIKVKADGGKITFSDGLGNGNTVTIASASGRIKNAFSISGSDTKELNVGATSLTRDSALTTYLYGKEMGVTFNGTTKNISMTKVLSRAGFSADDDETAKNLKFTTALQEELDGAFGKGKVTVSKESDGRLSLTPQNKGDVLTLGGSALKAMGFSAGDSNYINTSKKLTDLLGDRAYSVFSMSNRLKGAGGVIAKGNHYVDAAGNRVDKNGNRLDSSGKPLYDLNINGVSIGVTEDMTLEGLMSTINSNADAGVKVNYSKLTNEFRFTATESGANSEIQFEGLAKALFGTVDNGRNDYDTTKKLSDVLGAGYDYGSDYANFGLDIDGIGLVMMHADGDETMDGIIAQFNDTLKILKDAGETDKEITASFDHKTNSIVFEDEDGNPVQATAGSGVAKDLLGKIEKPEGGTYTAGQDAIVDVEVNGVLFEGLTRSSNTFDIDGLNITVKGEFETEEGEDPVTFSTSSDSDKIVEAIASMINDYNEMVAEIKNAYSTQPAYKNKKTRYEPLTAEQEAEYSESELKAYNEKAKQGILFSDTNLSSMYSKLLSAITPGGADGQTLREIGITTSYSDGLTTLTLDEDKLRNALDNDPDKVKDAFTKTAEGSSSNGLMASMQNVLNTYVKTTGEPKGVLITHSGSIKAPTSLNSNTLNSQMNSIDNQIERWESKMADQIDRYTTKFTKLEQLIAEMNSQSSALMGLMGGGSSY